MSSHCGKCYGQGHKEEYCDCKPIAPTFNKDETILKIIKQEMYYLGNSGWVMYCGTVGPEFIDDEGQNTYFAHKDEPDKLMSQRRAMEIQRRIDGF